MRGVQLTRTVGDWLVGLGLAAPGQPFPGSRKDTVVLSPDDSARFEAGTVRRAATVGRNWALVLERGHKVTG